MLQQHELFSRENTFLAILQSPFDKKICCKNLIRLSLGAQGTWVNDVNGC